MVANYIKSKLSIWQVYRLKSNPKVNFWFFDNYPPWDTNENKNTCGFNYRNLPRKQKGPNSIEETPEDERNPSYLTNMGSTN